VRVSANLSETYIPKFNGNRDLPVEEQIRVELSFPTLSQRGSLSGYKFDPGKNDISVGFDTIRILSNHVKQIFNLEDEMNGKVISIPNGKELAMSKNPGLMPLVEELEAIVTKREDIEEDDEKN